MFKKAKILSYKFLKWSGKWTKTDMIYLAKGGFWLSSGNTVSSLSGLLLSFAFANMLPIETFGYYKYALSMASILSISTLSGINTAIIRAVSRGHDETFKLGLLTKVKWGLIGGIVGLLISFYYFIHGNSYLTISFLIVSVFIPFMDPLNLYISYLNGKKNFKKIATFGILTKILSSLSIFISLFFTKNVFIILLTYFSSITLLRSIFTFLTFKTFKIREIKRDHETMIYGKHLSLMNLLNSVSTKLDNVIVFSSVGASELAIYSFSQVIPNQVKSFFKSMNALILPKLSQRDSGVGELQLYKKIAILTAITAVVLAFIILVIPTFFKLFFPVYRESVFLSQIFVASLITSPMQSIGGIYLYSQKKQKELYIYNSLSSITLLIFIFIGLHLGGVLGIVIGKSAQRFISIIILYFTINRKQPD